MTIVAATVALATATFPLGGVRALGVTVLVTVLVYGVAAWFDVVDPPEFL